MNGLEVDVRHCSTSLPLVSQNMCLVVQFFSFPNDYELADNKSREIGEITSNESEMRGYVPQLMSENGQSRRGVETGGAKYVERGALLGWRRRMLQAWATESGIL